MSFNNFEFSNSLLNLIESNGFNKAYSIQEKIIPLIIQQKDIIGIAKTGSGKTASYVLPIISTFIHKNDKKDRFISVLVIVPTRELAIQVSDVFISFKNGSSENIKIKSVYGGVSINPQMKTMNGVDILVATPGRLLDLLESKALHLSKVNTLVLDEADKLLNLGFKEELERIFKLLPNKRQNLLFSATLNKNTAELSNLNLKNPITIDINEDDSNNAAEIKQYVYLVAEERKGPLLRYLIEEKKMNKVLIFTSSIYKANNVAKKLTHNGIPAIAFHSKKSQSARTSSLEQFKEGKIQVLVATDLLSRGIDIDSLPYVINYELPRSPKDFIHRIGRTGRAESSGKAISLITPYDEHHFKVIKKKLNFWIDYIDTNEIDLRGY